MMSQPQGPWPILPPPWKGAKWEYTWFSIRLDHGVYKANPTDQTLEGNAVWEYINTCGAIGWELVNVVPRHWRPDPVYDSSIDVSQWDLWFKRKLV